MRSIVRATWSWTPTASDQTTRVDLADSQLERSQLCIFKNSASLSAILRTTFSRLSINQGRIQELPKGDGPWRARGERAYGGLGVEPPARSRGRAWWGSGAKSPSWSWKLFVYFHTKRAKSLVFKLKKTPYVWSMERPPGPPIPGSAVQSINHFFSGSEAHRNLRRVTHADRQISTDKQ